MLIIPIVAMIVLLVLCNYYIKNDELTKKILRSYFIIMFIIMAVSMLNPVGLYNVSNYTYILLGINIICTAIPIIILTRKNAESVQNKRKIDCDVIIKSKWILALEICACVILIYYFFKYLNIIGSIETSQIRIARFELLFNSSFETLFYNYIVSGIVTISTLIFSILLVNKKVKNPMFIVITTNIILYTLIGFGRMTIFALLIYIFFAILITKDIKAIINKKNIAILLTVIFIIFVCFSLIICVRMMDKQQSFLENIVQAINNQFNQIFEYFLGGIRMFDNFVQNGFPEFQNYTYGRATFAGLEEIILYPIKGIGIDIDSFNNLAVDIMSRASDVGVNTLYYNAFYTALMNFYLDFGIVGVILFSILHGIFIGVIIKKYEKNNNIWSLMLTIYVLKNLVLMILHWEYQGGSTMFVLIILLIINVIVNFKEKENIKDENTLDS